MAGEKLNLKWATIEGFVDRIHLPKREPGVVVVPSFDPPNQFYVFCNSTALAEKIYHNLQLEVSKISDDKSGDRIGVKSVGRIGGIAKPAVIIFTDPPESEDDTDVKSLHLKTALAAAGFKVNEMGDRPWDV